MAEKTINILLIDDDEVDVMNVKRAFQKNNLTNPMYHAGNGIEALQLLTSRVSHLLYSYVLRSTDTALTLS